MQLLVLLICPICDHFPTPTLCKKDTKQLFSVHAAVIPSSTAAILFFYSFIFKTEPCFGCLLYAAIRNRKLDITDTVSYLSLLILGDTVSKGVLQCI